MEFRPAQPYMASQSQSVAALPGSASQHQHGTLAAALLLSATGLLLAARRLRRFHRFHRFQRLYRRLRRSDKRGMPLGLFLFVLVLGVPLVVGGILVLCGLPVLTALLFGVGALVLLILGLLGALYFFGGEKE
jgi:Flp pilus assembly protein TadB